MQTNVRKRDLIGPALLAIMASMGALFHDGPKPEPPRTEQAQTQTQKQLEVKKVDERDMMATQGDLDVVRSRSSEDLREMSVMLQDLTNRVRRLEEHSREVDGSVAQLRQAPVMAQQPARPVTGVRAQDPRSRRGSHYYKGRSE